MPGNHKLLLFASFGNNQYKMKKEIVKKKTKSYTDKL